MAWTNGTDYHNGKQWTNGMDEYFVEGKEVNCRSGKRWTNDMDCMRSAKKCDKWRQNSQTIDED